MPVLQVYHPAGALDGGHKATLAQRLTEVLLSMEGGARTAGGVAFATVLFTEVPTGDWWVGGRTDGTYVTAPGKFLVRVSIPEGYMSQVYKTQVHQEVTAAILAVIGNPADPAQGASILVIIEEITEGDWGSHGRTIGLESIAASVGLPHDGERYRWLEAYFAAKARQYAAAGYPAEVGGLFKTQA